MKTLPFRRQKVLFILHAISVPAARESAKTSLGALSHAKADPVRHVDETNMIIIRFEKTNISAVFMECGTSQDHDERRLDDLGMSRLNLVLSDLPLPAGLHSRPFGHLRDETKSQLGPACAGCSSDGGPNRCEWLRPVRAGAGRKISCGGVLSV